MQGDTLQQHASDRAEELPGARLEHPFGPDWDVYKVRDKVFMLMTEITGEPIVIIKSDPEDAKALREQHADITPGYHMNKQHWITLHPEGACRSGSSTTSSPSRTARGRESAPREAAGRPRHVRRTEASVTPSGAPRTRCGSSPRSVSSKRRTSTLGRPRHDVRIRAWIQPAGGRGAAERGPPTPGSEIGTNVHRTSRRVVRR